MLVQDFLHHSAQRLPDKVALICDGHRLTYAEIDVMANCLANALIEHGVRRGDRVAIYLNNSIEAVVSIFATLKAGGVFVVVNHTTKRDKLTYILNNCRATALLTEARKTSLAHQVMADVPSLKFNLLCGKRAAQAAAGHERCLDFDAVQATYPAHRPPQTSIDLDLACLIYTSGSTGDPKGVMSDHSNVVFAASSIIEYLQNVEDDIVVNVLPLSFDYGLYQLLMVFKFGGTLVLEQSFAYPAAILKRMVEERVTGLPGVPTIFAILLQMDLSPYDLSSLRYLSNTGAALPPSHIQEIRHKFPGAAVYSMYGLTETKRTLYLPPDQLDRRPGSVGIAIPGTEVWIEDEAGNRLGPGEIGELVARGRHVMRGYWENPQATAARYRPGPLPGERVCYSGDLFRMDEEGYMYFVGRKDDIIKSRGEKVAPKEVENVLYALHGVVETAVIGVPDPIMGEAVKAFVVANGAELTEAEVFAHCRAHLEDFMVPKYVEFRDQLPKTSSGKIKKTGLK
jgi:long-chain acyl-CoA synthetase